MQNILELVRLIPGYRGRFARVLMANVLLGLGAVITPYLFKHIVDNIVALAGRSVPAAEARNQVVLAIVILGGIRLATIIFGYFQERASDLLFFETMWGLRKQLFRHLTELSIDYYEQHRVARSCSGSVMPRCSYGVSCSNGLRAHF